MPIRRQALLRQDGVSLIDDSGGHPNLSSPHHTPPSISGEKFETRWVLTSGRGNPVPFVAIVVVVGAVYTTNMVVVVCRPMAVASCDKHFASSLRLLGTLIGQWVLTSGCLLRQAVMCQGGVSGGKFEFVDVWW